MFQVLRNAWKIVDLRKKILFTFFIILIFRIGSAISVPFVDVTVFTKEIASNDFMNLLSLMSGGGFSSASLFSLSITPYINASIIIQLLTVALPPLERLAKEGEAGRKKLNQITRYATIGLGLLLGVAYYFMIRDSYQALVPEAKTGFGGVFAAIVIVLCFCAGSALVMWLGEQINEKGIGNGISILLFAGIISGIPSAAVYLWRVFYEGGIQMLGQSNQAIGNIILVPVALILFLLMIGFIVFLSNAERRIPVQYAKKVVGRKMYGGQSTFIPIKVNTSGVMPIILASSILALPSIIASFVYGGKNPPSDTFWGGFFNFFKSTNGGYLVLLFVLIIAFAYFYVTIQYNPVEMANNLRKNSGAIPGYRPGKPTSDFIKRVLSKVTLIGALFLGVIAVFPGLFGMVTGMNLSLGGTSIMIVVGVALETMEQMESQMMMRHYKGFLD